MKTNLFITALAFFAVTSIGFSQKGQPQNQPGKCQGNCQVWVDENKNGVCDNYENRAPAQGKGNGNGFCMGRNQDHQGKRMMNGQGGRNFIDENKNGVCDRFENLEKERTEKKQN
jgi:hypothetical protein